MAIKVTKNTEINGQLARLRKTGWIFIFIGFFGSAILTTLTTFLKKFSLSVFQCNQNFKVEISGFSFGVFGLFIVCGIILIMLEGLQMLVQKTKWGKK